MAKREHFEAKADNAKFQAQISELEARIALIREEEDSKDAIISILTAEVKRLEEG